MRDSLALMRYKTRITRTGRRSKTTPDPVIGLVGVGSPGDSHDRGNMMKQVVYARLLDRLRDVPGTSSTCSIQGTAITYLRNIISTSIIETFLPIQ